MIVFPGLTATLASAPSGGFAVPGAGAGGAAPTTTGAPGAAGGGTPPPPGGLGGNGMIFLMVGLLGFMLITTMFSGRKQKKQRAEMLGGLAKHDRVQTVGGMIGTIAEMRGDELVLKVDEGSNTRVRVARSAIQVVLKQSREHGETDVDDAPDPSERAA